MRTEIKVNSNRSPLTSDVSVYDGEILIPEAKFILALVERWGMVSAIDAGEDSNGRQKLRLMTPEELVARAASIAKLAFETVRKNNLTINAPTLEELAALKEKQKEN